MTANQVKPKFSNLQLELLMIYSNGVSDEQLTDIKWMLGKYFAEKATEETDKIIDDKKLSEADIVFPSVQVYSPEEFKGAYQASQK